MSNLLNPYRFATAAPAAYFVTCDGTGDYITTPDDPGLDTTTSDLDIRFDGACDDWAGSGSNQLLVHRFEDTVGGFGLRLNSAGTLRLFWHSGGAFNNADSTTTPSVSDGERLQVRATLDADNGSGYEVLFYTRDPGLGLDLLDDTSWSQLGSSVTGGSSTSVGSSPSVRCTIGANVNNGAEFAGDIYDACYLDSIDGTVIVRMDPNDGTLGDTGGDTFTDSDTSFVWTLNGNATISS